MRWIQGVSALVVGLNCSFVSMAVKDTPILRVFVLATAGEDAVSRAEVESSRILERAGVRVIWQNCRHDDPCKSATDSEDITLRILEQTGKSGLGCSLVTRSGGVSAVIGFGNIQRLAESTRIPKSQILGAVMAHEVGHLMLGPAHSETGLMHGHWDVRDLSHLEQRQLKFDPDQCGRMRAAVLARSQPERSLLAARRAGL